MTADRAAALLRDAFDRVHDAVPTVLDGLTDDRLRWRPSAEANSIAWLIWHLARVEDDHLAGVGGGEQVWTGQGWAERFALPLDAGDIGYGHTSEQAGTVHADAEQLLGYYDAVHASTVQILDGLTDADYDRVVDRRWTPPVTAAVRLVSVVNDITQHLGQAAYVRGMLPAG